MAKRDSSSPTPMPTILRYGIAVLSVAIAIGLAFFVLRHFEAILTPFLFAVAATVWYAGTGPGVLAIVLSVLSLNHFFLRPFFSFGPIGYADLVYLAFCTFCALAVGWVSAVRRRAEQELRQAREELDAKVVERTASLQRSERYLAESQRLGHCGVAAYNQTTVLYGSEEIYRIWGFDPAQGVPSRKAVFQRIHPDDRDRLNAEVQRAVGEKRRYSIGYRIVLPDGTVKHLESTGQPVFSASGKLVEIISTQLDVTERKRVEQALRESEAKFRDYAESAADWYWETDPDHKFTRVTDYERLLARGFAPVSRIGLARWEFSTDVESEPEKWELHRSILEARQPFRDFVYRAARSDGSLVYYKISGKPVFDANGEFRGYRGTGTDVTAITRAQEVLRENERSLRLAIDGIAGLVAVLAPNGELEAANRQLFEYFGRSLEELKNWGT
ncbi:MAG TPA: PAS domain-containing protein, partial [Steroidobacteraceae bacterium]|nr:PAS domain-containing protein [Steroidobacteraceae bacterium]